MKIKYYKNTRKSKFNSLWTKNVGLKISLSYVNSSFEKKNAYQ